MHAVGQQQHQAREDERGNAAKQREADDPGQEHDEAPTWGRGGSYFTGTAAVASVTADAGASAA